MSTYRLSVTRLTILLALGLFLGIPFYATAQVYKSQHGRATIVSHATLEDFTGQSSYLVGQVNLADSTVDFYLDLSTLSTGVELRDEHMQEEFLETNKYPFAQFSGKLVSHFNSATDDTQQVKVKGQFKIHGVSRTITVSGQMAKRKDHIYLHANWQLELPDYHIAIPKVLFMKVSKTQELSITSTLKETDKKR